MDFIIVAGFLGSGKTSVLLPLAHFLVEKGRKLAIIENEVGKVGVDGDHLRQEGLQVKELYSGCVCCQLRYDLINTLYDLERQFHPDVVIMEPSGVASPGQLMQGLAGYGGNLENKLILVLIDAVRFQAIRDFGIPLITDGIEAADLIAVNKIDRISGEQLEDLNQKIRHIKPDAAILPICGIRTENLGILLQAVETKLSQRKDITPSAPTVNPNAPAPTVHARELSLSFSPPVSSEMLAGKIQTLLAHLAQDLLAEGCTLIGHLKAILRPPKGGFLLFNLTDPTEGPRRRGGIAPTLDQARLTINAIVYGLDPITLAEKVAAALANLQTH